MATTVAHALRVLQERTAVDPALAEAVVFLAGDGAGPDDPFAAAPAAVLSAARRVDEQRLVNRRRRAEADALDTPAVVALVGSLHDRKGVDRRRHRGQLLGWRSGRRTLHPAWQFDRRRGETFPGLPAVLAALADVAADPETADALMRAPRPDLGGRSLADHLAAGRVDEVVRLLRAAGEQS